MMIMTTSATNYAQTPTPWLPYPCVNPGASLRMFCFPYAGGGASIYYGWLKALPASVEVCPVQLPGREHRLSDPLFTQLPEMVRAVRQVVLPSLDKPFVLYGHSMGGLLAYELARLLRREGDPQPQHLFVSGCRAPHLAVPDRITYNLPEPELLEELRTLNGTPEEVIENPELMQLLLPVLRADFEVVETYAYAPEPPLDLPISVFGGLEDENVDHRHLEGWREHTTASCSVRMMPGDHFFLRPAQADLLRLMARELRPLADSIAWGWRI
jgi:medium-chain acyl-[acyl-carrier-protein] hydrolase